MLAWSASTMEMQPVAHHGGDDAGRAIGRRGDDAAAGGVLLVDGHGVDRQPVIGEQRVRPVLAPFLLQLVMQLAGAAAHLQPARHDAVLRQAAVDAARSSRSQIRSSPASSSSRDMSVSSLARFISAIERPLLRRHGQHLDGVGEGIGHGFAPVTGPRALQRAAAPRRRRRSRRQSNSRRGCSSSWSSPS